MARYLVIELEDNDSADKLREKIDNARAQGALYRVVGLFVQPRRVCTCATGPAQLGGMNFRKPSSKHGVGGGVVRGGKFGWWVCTACKRPRCGSHQLVNQLKGEELYEHWNADQPWEFVAEGLHIGPIWKKNLTRRVLGKIKTKKLKEK